jgi:hypothetical protein
MDNETRIKELEIEVKRLRDFVYKNDFSNLYVYDTPVQFKKPNLYPTDNTAIATSTTDSTGRIAILIAGVTKYLPYF